MSDFDALDAYWQLTGKYPNGRTLDWLNRLIDDFGDERVSVALAIAVKADDPSTLLSRTQDILRRDAHRAAVEAEQRRQEAERQQIAEYESRMPPEQRAANLERLRAEMERLGLITRTLGGC